MTNRKMKGILIAQKPRDCENIASGKKTIIVCKKMPKLQTPFKGYIFCTKGKPFIQKIRFGDIAISHTQISKNLYNGRVIGEFICLKTLYGLYITDLKIYDKPKELSEFSRPCSYDGLCSTCKRFKANGSSYDICNSTVTRPPQGWIYVEELEDSNDK